MQKVGAKPSGALAGYIGKDSESGDRFLVKFVETPEHAANEVLAAHLYRSAGVCVSDIRRGRVRKTYATAASRAAKNSLPATLAVQYEPLRTPAAS